MKIERDKLYRARDGEIYRVICIDRGVCDNPVVGINVKNGHILTWGPDGTFANTKHPYDFIAEVRSPREWLLTRSVTSDEWEVAPLNTVLPKDEFVTVRVREILDETPR